jgi:hypothetical protein
MAGVTVAPGARQEDNVWASLCMLYHRRTYCVSVGNHPSHHCFGVIICRCSKEADSWPSLRGTVGRRSQLIMLCHPGPDVAQ